MVVHADPSQGRVTLELSFSEATVPVAGVPFAEKLVLVLKPRWGEPTREKSKVGLQLSWLCIPSLTAQLKAAVENAGARASS